MSDSMSDSMSVGKNGGAPSRSRKAKAGGAASAEEVEVLERVSPGKLADAVYKYLCQAVDELGGPAYFVRLAKQEPRAFALLIAKCMPSVFHVDAADSVRKHVAALFAGAANGLEVLKAVQARRQALPMPSERIAEHMADAEVGREPGAAGNAAPGQTVGVKVGNVEVMDLGYRGRRRPRHP